MHDMISPGSILNKVYETIINSKELKILLNYSEKYDQLINGLYHKYDLERDLAKNNLDEAKSAKTSYGQLTFFKKFSKRGIKMKLQELKIPKYNRIYNKKTEAYHRIKRENEHIEYLLESELYKHIEYLFPEYLKKVFEENNFDYTNFDFKFITFETLPIDVEEFKYELGVILHLYFLKYNSEKYTKNTTTESINNSSNLESGLGTTSKKAS